MKWIGWETKYYLSKIPFYRKYKGGKWYKVIPDYDCFYNTYWIDRKPLYNERIVSIENW